MVMNPIILDLSGHADFWGKISSFGCKISSYTEVLNEVSFELKNFSTYVSTWLLIFSLPMLYDTSYYNMGDVTEQHADLFIGGSQQASPVTSEQQAYQLSLQSVHQQNTSPNTQQTVFTVSFLCCFFCVGWHTVSLLVDLIGCSRDIL